MWIRYRDCDPQDDDKTKQKTQSNPDGKLEYYFRTNAEKAFLPRGIGNYVSDNMEISKQGHKIIASSVNRRLKKKKT